MSQTFRASRQFIWKRTTDPPARSFPLRIPSSRKVRPHRLPTELTPSDRDRIPKNLYTSHPKSTPATLKLFSTPVIEASFIATEIKRLIAYSGGVLNHGDFAILRESRRCREMGLTILQCGITPFLGLLSLRSRRIAFRTG
jgi:hypothetical protein